MNMPPGMHLVVGHVAYTLLIIVAHFRDAEGHVPTIYEFGAPNEVHAHTSYVDTLGT